MTKNKFFGHTFEVDITDTTVEGKGVARFEDKVFFVSNAIPGDKALIKVISKKRKYYEAQIDKLIVPSPYRETPKCKHFGICGGCKWQHMKYEQQLLFKEKQVIDQFERIGKIFAPHFLIQSSQNLFHYRNKLEFTFSTQKWYISPNDNNTPVLGFHIPGRFDKILDIDECYLQPSPSNEIRNYIRNLALHHNIPFYNSKTHEGFLRNLIIRNNSMQEFMIILSVKYYHSQWILLIAEHIKKHFSQVISFYVAINEKLNDTLDGIDLTLVFGNPTLTEIIHNLTFNISPKAFMQVNYYQTLNLYQKILEWTNLSGKETIYDLYCGIGTITLLLAQKAKHVVGIEFVEEAVNDAINNAKINKISNVTFLCGDVKNTLHSTEIKKHNKPDIIILDPPRAGINADVLQKIINLNPKKIIYVSCNASTQARDISLLSSFYKVQKYQPFDMFPHTSHVENIALLENFSTK